MIGAQYGAGTTIYLDHRTNHSADDGGVEEFRHAFDHECRGNLSEEFDLFGAV
jgi:hypothetical protein